MKKLIAFLTLMPMLLSAVVFSACDSEKDSDIVTAEEWTSAMLASNALNVTVTGCYRATSTTTTDGLTEDGGGEGSDFIIKTALTISGTNITGNTYIYSLEYERFPSNGIYYDGTSVMTKYEVFGEDCYSYVRKVENKSTETNEETSQSESTEDTDWYGKYYSESATPNSSDAYYSCKRYITLFSDMYDYFEYIDGEYRYSDEDEGAVYYIKINDKKITRYVREETYTYSHGTYSYTEVYSYVVEFSDYGKTTVTVPDDYTYEYYYLNQVQ